MNKRFGFLLFVLALILIRGADAGSHELSPSWEPLSSHTILLDGLTWVAYDIECQEGDEISGSFEVTCDGSLYFGDEQKYDDWSVEGIQFFILDEGNYSLFVEGEAPVASYERNDVFHLSWTFTIPKDGDWFIIYYNDTIYLMDIDGIINLNYSSNSLGISVLVVFGIFGLLASGVMLKRKNESHG